MCYPVLMMIMMIMKIRGRRRRKEGERMMMMMMKIFYCNVTFIKNLKISFQYLLGFY